MEARHTVFFGEAPDKTRNATIYRDYTAQIEGAVLMTVAVVGGLGNLIIFIFTTACSRFKTTSCAFLSHHCILDSVKSIYCIPFACALLLDIDIPYCNALGATYIFLMTLTAYNLLAIHINEEYQLTDRHGYIPGENKAHRHYRVDDKNSFSCVSFGIFMIWFTAVLLHLGVAFLPSSAEFSYQIGNCVFRYGTRKNYVIHILWTILVTAALVIAIICFTTFFCKLKARMNSEKWTLLHTSISREMNHAPPSPACPGCQHTQMMGQADTRQEQDATEELHYEFADDMADQTATKQMQLCLRRVVIMLLMVISFLLFWYPLFILTIFDINYSHPPQQYRICMIVAWAHPVTTPVFCGIIYFDMLHIKAMSRSVYSAAIPLKDSASFSSGNYPPRDDVWQTLPQRYRLDDVGFTNENFSFSHHGSPCRIQRQRAVSNDLEDLEDLSCEGHRQGQSVEHDGEIDSVPPCLVHSVMNEGQEHGAHHSCSAQDSYQTLIM